jgi:hypothetical protein
VNEFANYETIRPHSALRGISLREYIEAGGHGPARIEQHHWNRTRHQSRRSKERADLDWESRQLDVFVVDVDRGQLHQPQRPTGSTAFGSRESFGRPVRLVIAVDNGGDNNFPTSVFIDDVNLGQGATRPGSGEGLRLGTAFDPNCGTICLGPGGVSGGPGNT